MGEALISRSGSFDGGGSGGKGYIPVTEIIQNNQTFIMPKTNGQLISVLLFGAGGKQYANGGGGGGGNMNNAVLNIPAGTKISIIIGSNSMNNGGATSFGTYLAATGGQYGTSDSGGNGGSGGGSGSGVYTAGVYLYRIDGYGGDAVYGGGGGGGINGGNGGTFGGGGSGYYGGTSLGGYGHGGSNEIGNNGLNTIGKGLEFEGGGLAGTKYGGGGGYGGNGGNGSTSDDGSGCVYAGGGGGGYGGNGGNGYIDINRWHYSGSRYNTIYTAHGGGGGGYGNDGWDGSINSGGGGGGYGLQGFGHGGGGYANSLPGVCILTYSKLVEN